jgi:DNA-binding transcriptional MerR regulator
MRVVSEKTGLTPDLLRAWERRYRVVKPRRSSGGQRLYSDADIERLRQLHRAVLAGHSIGRVVELDHAGLEALVEGRTLGIPASDTPPIAEMSALARAVAECLAAAEQLDGAALARALKQASHRFAIPLLLDHLIAPLLREIGERWESGSLLPIHEHVASVEVHRFLTEIVQSTPIRTDSPLLAVATPAGQQMELGALMVAASAVAEGWRVAWFGPNLPADDIVHGVLSLKPLALAISLVHQTRDPELHRQLQRIAEGVRGKAQLLVGGRAAAVHSLMLERLGGIVMTELSALRRWLTAAQATTATTLRTFVPRSAAPGLSGAPDKR